MTGFQNWYNSNKEDFNAKRRARYASNKTYRQRVNSYTRRARSDENRKILKDGSVITLRENGKFVPCYRMGVTAEKVGVAPHIIRTLEKRKLIPMVGSDAARHMRYYTNYQIMLIRLLLVKMKARRLGGITEDTENAFVLHVKREWNK